MKLVECIKITYFSIKTLICKFWSLITRSFEIIYKSMDKSTRSLLLSCIYLTFTLLLALSYKLKFYPAWISNTASHEIMTYLNSLDIHSILAVIVFLTMPMILYFCLGTLPQMQDPIKKVKYSSTDVWNVFFRIIFGAILLLITFLPDVQISSLTDIKNLFLYFKNKDVLFTLSHFTKTINLLEISSTHEIMLKGFIADYFIINLAQLIDFLLYRSQKVLTHLSIGLYSYFKIMLVILIFSFQFDFFSELIEMKHLIIGLTKSYFLTILIVSILCFISELGWWFISFTRRLDRNNPKMPGKLYSPLILFFIFFGIGSISIPYCTSILTWSNYLESFTGDKKFLSSLNAPRVISQSKSKDPALKHENEHLESKGVDINPVSFISSDKDDLGKDQFIEANNKRSRKSVELLPKLIWGGFLYVEILPFILLSAIFISTNIDGYKRSDKGLKDIFRDPVKATMITLDALLESPIALSAGLSINIMISLSPWLFHLMKIQRIPLAKPSGIVVSNMWVLSLVLWLTPLLAGLFKLRKQYESIYIDRLERVLSSNSNHTVVIGSGDLGRQVVERLTKSNTHESAAAIILPSGSVSLLLPGIVVVDKKPDQFEEPVKIGETLLMIFRINMRMVGKKHWSGIQEDLLVPAVIGDIRHTDIQAMAGFERARTIIGVPRDVTTFISLFDCIQSHEGDTQAILSVESSFNIPYNVFRTLKARLPVFFIHSDYLRGMNTAGMIVAGIHKMTQSGIDRQRVLIIGSGSHVGYLIDNFNKLFHCTNQDHWPQICVFSKADSPTAQTSTVNLDVSGNYMVDWNRCRENGIEINLTIHEIMQTFKENGLEIKLWKMVDFTARETSRSNFVEKNGLFIKGYPGDMPEMQTVLTAFKPTIVVLNHLDPIEQLKSLRTYNNALLRWLQSDDIPDQPLLLIGAETGAGARSQNVGDAYARKMSLQVSSGYPLLPPPEKNASGPVTDTLLRSPQKWLYPNRAGFSNDFALFGDGMIDILEDPLEKISSMYHSLQKPKPLSVLLCANYTCGSLAQVTRNLAGYRQRHETRTNNGSVQFNRIPNFFLSQVCSREKDCFCFHCLAFLRQPYQSTEGKPVINRAVVIPAYESEKSDPLYPYPSFDVNGVQDLVWGSDSRPGITEGGFAKLCNKKLWKLRNMEDIKKDLLSDCPGTSSCIVDAFQSHLQVLKSLTRVSQTTLDNIMIPPEITDKDKLARYLKYLDAVYRKTTHPVGNNDNNNNDNNNDNVHDPFARISVCCNSSNVPGALAVVLSTLLGQRLSFNENGTHIMDLTNIGVDHCHDKRFVQMQLNGNLLNKKDVKKIKDDCRRLCENPPINSITIRAITQVDQWMEYANTLNRFLDTFPSDSQRSTPFFMDSTSEKCDDELTQPFCMMLRRQTQDEQTDYECLHPCFEKGQRTPLYGFCPLDDLRVHDGMRTIAQQLKKAARLP
jgi:hypothetical protein